MANRSPSEMLSLSFWCGFWFHLFLTQVFMDFLGLSEYILWVEDNWTNTHWMMWVALCVLIVYIHKKQQGSVE